MSFRIMKKFLDSKQFFLIYKLNDKIQNKKLFDLFQKKKQKKICRLPRNILDIKEKFVY